MENIDSLDMYLREMIKYPLLSASEEKHYCALLKNPKEKKLLLFKHIGSSSMPSLNTTLLFCSLCNNSAYKEIINDLILFYDGLEVSSDPVIKVLEKYQEESNILGRALNINDLQRIFNITYNGNTLSEKDLLKEIKSFMNYKLAFKKMFESNLRLVAGIASKYNWDVDMIDLIEEGNLALMKAIICFDVSLGYKFSTYATICIKQWIRRYVNNNNRSIKLPEYLGSDLHDFKRKVEALKEQEKRSLSPSEIAEKLSMPIDLVNEYQSYMYIEIPLNEPVGEGDNMTLQDMIPSDINVEDIAMKKMLETDIQCLLDCLTEREQDIIKMRFGLGEYNGKTYSILDIGKKYSVSSQRIAQLESKSLFRMKRFTKLYEKEKALEEYTLR